MDKEVKHEWSLSPTMDSICRVKDTGTILLVVAKKFPINEKGGRYTKIFVIHNCSLPGPSGNSVSNILLRDTL